VCVCVCVVGSRGAGQATQGELAAGGGMCVVGGWVGGSMAPVLTVKADLMGL
jgi:hypothetical protein